MCENNLREESLNKELNFAVASEVLGWTVEYRYCEIDPGSGEWRERETHINWFKNSSRDDTDISFRIKLDDIQSGAVKKLCRLEFVQNKESGEVASVWRVIDDFTHNPYPVIRKIMEKGYSCRLSIVEGHFKCVLSNGDCGYTAMDKLDGVAVCRAAIGVVNAENQGMLAESERQLIDACERAGVTYFGTDAPDVLACEILSLRDGRGKSKSFHTMISVDSMLKCSKMDFDKVWKGVFHNDAGEMMTYQQVREVFLEHKRLGHKVFPCGDCNNFDWDSGCQGHEES